MLNQLKFAAIDIGSNAVRLLLASVFENNGRPTFKKMSLTRMPIRLGADTFSLKHISKERTDELVKAMTGFRYLIDAYQPIAFRACATSAMREAENRAQICKRIRKASGIEERITELNLRPDRADVIIPGADIYLKVVQWAGIKNIYVPVMGLADGVVRILYSDYKAQGAVGHSP